MFSLQRATDIQDFLIYSNCRLLKVLTKTEDYMKLERMIIKN